MKTSWHRIIVNFKLMPLLQVNFKYFSFFNSSKVILQFIAHIILLTLAKKNFLVYLKKCTKNGDPN